MSQANRPIRPADFASPAQYWRAVMAKMGLALVSVGLMIVVVFIGVVLYKNSDGVRTPGALEPSIVGSSPQSSVLLVRTDKTGQLGEGMTLFASDGNGKVEVMFIPVTTVMEIPGVGQDKLSLAVQYGGVELARATIENELEIRIDSVMYGTNEQLASWFQAMGGIQYEVPQTLKRREDDGTVTVKFERGKQYLNGPAMIDYLSFVGVKQNELDTFVRQQKIWLEVFGILEQKQTVENVFKPAPINMHVSGSPDVVKAIFTTGASARKDDALTFTVLPVKAVSTTTSGQDVFALKRAEIHQVIDRSFAGLKPQLMGDQIIRLQVLNGVGTPGVGQLVSEQLQDLAVRIVLTENAQSFNHPTTKIIVYSESRDMYNVAKQIKAKLGVGEIMYSQQPQSLVKATIIVGQDFIDAHPKEAPAPAAATPTPTPSQ